MQMDVDADLHHTYTLGFINTWLICDMFVTAVTKDATNYKGSSDLTGRTAICEYY